MKLKRIYGTSDEEMLATAEIINGNLGTDLAGFTLRFPWVNAAYRNSFRQDIEIALKFPPNETVRTNIKVPVSDVSTAMKVAREKLSSLFLFASITYANDKARQRVFGQDQMAAARANQDKMISLLKHAHSMASVDPQKTDLLNRGYQQAEIDALLAFAGTLEGVERTKKDVKSFRPVTTQERIALHNKVYTTMRTIHQCARVVFAGNKAKINQYRYRPGTRDKDEEE